VVEDSGLPNNEAYSGLNRAQNFLKHADRDSTAELSFDEAENGKLIFLATLEWGDLGHPLSFVMHAFQIWYLASSPRAWVKKSSPRLPPALQ
jgi:hypothetical protein